MSDLDEPDWVEFWRKAARFQREQLWLTRLTTALCIAFLIYLFFAVSR